MDDMHVLTDAVRRGWKTSEFLLVVAFMLAMIIFAPALSVSIAVAVVVAAYCVSRALVKSATASALLAPVVPPVTLTQRAITEALDASDAVPSSTVGRRPLR